MHFGDLFKESHVICSYTQRTADKMLKHYKAL